MKRVFILCCFAFGVLCSHRASAHTDGAVQEALSNPPAVAQQEADAPSERPSQGVLGGAILEHPLAWAAAGTAVGCLMAAAFFWTTGPNSIPVLGQLPYVQVTDGQWTTLQIVALSGAAVAALTSVLLFVWPVLPFAGALRSRPAGGRVPPPT